MRILVTADPELPVPPGQYGGIERVVDMLVRGLLDRGHDVALLANRRSRTPATLIGYRGSDSRSVGDVARHAAQLWSAVHIHRPDLVHSFGRVAYLTPVLARPLPKIQSYQRAVTPRTVRWARRVARDSLTFTACSRWLAASGARFGGRWAAVPNGLPRHLYTPVTDVHGDAPLVFLGRLERIKGAHNAIEVARRSGRHLVIAGNVVQDGGRAERYFDEELLPHVDGEQITYVGPVDDRQKNVLLGSAAALLMPIEWDEPFGIVMAEALACGTPVIAFARGAAPEVVESEKTGFLCDDIAGMVRAIALLDRIDRRACREAFERRLADDVVVEQYERLYRTRLDR